MTEAQENWDRKDPSENVVRLVTDTVNYFEKLLQLHKETLEKEIKFQVESSQRERETESKRLNELRENDREAVKIANEQAMEIAETLRKSVENTATAVAEQLSTITSEIVKRVAALEKIQNENYGRSIATPDLQKMVGDLVSEHDVTKGRQKISSPLMFAMVSVGGGLFMALIIFVIQALSI